jgi:hypothetical protein
MRRFSALFRENAELKTLSGVADSLTVSQNLWAAIVPEALRPFTQAGAVKQQRLTVYADNGAVAAKTKLLLPSLLPQLQKLGLEVTSIRVEVQVKSSPRKPPRPRRNISPQSAARLNALAEELSGSELGEALKRLSRHT